MRFTVDTDDGLSLEVSKGQSSGLYLLNIGVKDLTGYYLTAEEVKQLRYALHLALQDGGDK